MRTNSPNEQTIRVWLPWRERNESIEINNRLNSSPSLASSFPLKMKKSLISFALACTIASIAPMIWSRLNSLW
ncbi:hypothetical protein DSECCO2_636950 [anaerobic digester metagenome]